MGWPQGALSIVGAEASTKSKRFAVMLMRGRLLAATGEHRKAASAFYICIKENPRHAPALLGMVRALFELGLIEVAERVAALAIEADTRPRVRRAIDAMRARARTRNPPADLAGIVTFATAKRSAFADRDLPAMLLKISRRQRSRFAKRIRAMTARESAGRAQKARRLNSLDLFYSGVVLIQSLIVNKLIRSSATSYILVLKTFAMIVGHLYLWYAVSRSMPSGLSSITFTLPAFAVYVSFNGGFNKLTPREPSYPVFAGRRIGVAAFIVSDMVWEILCVILGTVMSLIYCFAIVPGMFNFEPLRFDVPTAFGLIVLAYLVGIALQSVVQRITHFAPSLHSAAYLLSPAIFMTSGVYEAYVSEPVQMQGAVWWNPIAAVVEFSRQSFAPGYSTGDLSIVYSISFAVVGFLFFMLQSNFSQSPAR
jgi:ABC-type polysaccharide/polyol phosphate export permease